MSEFFNILNGILNSILQVFAWVWWIVIPLGLIFIAWDFWKFYIHFKFLKTVKYNLLEIHIPKDIIKTPKSMENIFATFHATRMSIDTLKKKYIEGQTQLWLSLELVGTGGGVEFYIRTPEQFRNLIEAQIYAQYPDAEIVEAEDYVSFLPKYLPNKYFDIWAAEFGLAKDSAYPIRTYPYFEEVKEEKRLDPIASWIETMSKLKSDERIWIQILIKYTGDDWKKEADKLVAKLAGKKSKAEMGLFDWILQFLRNLIKAPVVYPEWEGGAEEKEGPASQMSSLTPGEKDIIKAIEEKVSKLGFETVVRCVYIDRRDAFSRLNVSSIMGGINQFSTQNLNAFKGFKPTSISAKPPFKSQKEFLKKRMLYLNYRMRMFNGQIKAVLNTEELATIYHFPIMGVAAPFLRRIEAKKGEPPINLPIG
jgi:hypothetical protein